MTSLPPLTANASLRWDIVRHWFPAPLRPSDPHDVLEIGCGQGAVGARLAASFRYVGLEVDPESFEVAQQRVKAAGGVVRDGDLSLLAADARFDAVCAFEVIEHIEHDGAALAEWAGRLRPGGWLILSTPGHPELFGAGDEMAGHFRRYTPDGLAGLLRDAGLVDVEVRPYGGPLGFVLERARSVILGRRLARAPQRPIDERTHGSGRILQPEGAAAVAVKAAGLPLRLAQRLMPRVGPGLVARGRAPSA